MSDKTKFTTKDIALIGMMIAVIEVSKIALAHIPNVELTSFWIIVFTMYFGRRIWPVIPAFILIEGLMYGFGLWWIMYLYAWPLLAVIILIIRKRKSYILCCLISGAFGLAFGFLCSFPYVFMGATGADLTTGIKVAFAWWVAGIPWDIVHGVANFIIMLVLYHPVTKIMRKLKIS